MNDDPLDAVRAVRRAAQRLSRRLRAERPTGGLTDLQLQVLAAVMDYGPTTSAGLTGTMRTTPQALTRTIASLTDAGFLARAPMPDDKRQYLLTISRAGWEALAADAAPRDAWLNDAMGSLTAAERDLLVIAASLMTRLARSDVADPPADPSRTARPAAASSPAASSPAAPSPTEPTSPAIGTPEEPR